MLIKQGERLINARNWSELVKPDQILREEETASGTHGKFICEPLERGYGTTIGNAMRRVLLASLQGAAFVSVKITGVQHEFTTIHGVLEDVTDVILNLKQVRLRLDTDEPQRLILRVDRKGPVTAAQIQTNQHVEVLNPELHIATLTEDVVLEMELEARMGKGYVPADMHEGLSEEIGLIKLDSSFSPVRKVAYTVEQARVGQMTNYDRLLLEVWTDGSLTPEDAIAYSAKIIKDQISVFINFDERVSGDMRLGSSDGGEVNEHLFKSIDDLELSVRATNCLRSANIALGGEPWCAMNVACFPQALAEDDPEQALTNILRGGQDALLEAGAVLAGGHTVQDDELKYGLAVTGIIDPAHIAVNDGLRPGQCLLLTKALGTGILATAVKARWEGAAESEAELIIRAFHLPAATDITGFGLGGHALEMALASNACVALDTAALPLLPRVLEYARDGLIPAGSHLNRKHWACSTLVEPGVDEALESVTFDAQTSGGLLLAVPPDLLGPVRDMLESGGDLAREVGEVLPPRTDGKALLLR